MKVSKINLIFFIIFLLGFFISSVASYVLPERFFLDANTILQTNAWGLSFKDGQIIGSYPFTIWFYKVTGLKHLSFSILGPIQYTILYFIFYKIGIPKDFSKATIKNFVLYFLLLILAIYVSVPSKEFINFIYISIIVFVVKNRKYNFKKTILVSILLISFLGYFFRQYYLIVILLTIFLYTLSFIKIKNYKLAIVTYGLTFLIGISLSYGYVAGVFLSDKTRGYMAKFNLSNSSIKPPLSTDTWYGESVSIIHGFFSVNIPINGFKFFLQPQILLFVIWQLLFLLVIIKRYDKSIKEGKRKNYELFLFYILFSYFITQGIFEPDLGSALRHKASVFPIIYYLLNYESFRKNV